MQKRGCSNLAPPKSLPKAWAARPKTQCQGVATVVERHLAFAKQLQLVHALDIASALLDHGEVGDFAHTVLMNLAWSTPAIRLLLQVL